MKLAIQEYKTKVIDIYNHLHKNPEISWKEFETTAFLKRIFDEERIQAVTFDDIPGIVATIGKGDPKVGLRADMDALWQEVDGVFQGNHSCGHDAHMTMVIGVILVLNKLKDLKGTYKFIFQPAEEKGTGALELIKRGVVDDLDFLFGVHLRPEVELANGKATPSIIHGAARFIQGKIIGEDAHGARPHLNANAIQIGADIVHMLNGIHMNPMIPYSVKITQFQAGGESPNIIPGSGTFSIDLRAQTNDVMRELTNQVNQIISILSNQYSIEITTEITADIAAAAVSEEATQIMESAISNVMSREGLVAPTMTTGGDDFHFYTLERPKLKATMLGLGCGLYPGLHHPQMTFEKNAMFIGIDILAHALLLTSDMGKEA